MQRTFRNYTFERPIQSNADHIPDYHQYNSFSTGSSKKNVERKSLFSKGSSFMTRCSNAK